VNEGGEGPHWTVVPSWREKKKKKKEEEEEEYIQSVTEAT